MQVKNSLLLLTALTAGSAVARLHGHDRRHAHHNQEKRAVGDVVYATINGVVESWTNEWTGESSTAVTESVQLPTPVAVKAASTSVVVASASVTPTGSPSPSSSSGPSVDWTSTPSDGQFTRKGFGGKTTPGGHGIFYKGNVGIPWGSNIIEVSADEAKQYKHVAEFKGAIKEPWTLVFWNKIGPTGLLDGWYGHSALTIKISPGETKYVAFDDDSQGGWGAAPGDDLPRDMFGGYACTWGEFDFSSTVNRGWSGWDVSAIQAQAAGFEVQGMKICDHLGQGCSIIASNAASIINAYDKALAGVDGIGGNVPGGNAVRLSVELDFS